VNDMTKVWVELAVLVLILIYVLKTLYDINRQEREEAEDEFPAEPTSDTDTPTLIIKKPVTTEQVPPPVSPKTSLRLGEEYTLEEKETEGEAKTAPLVVTELIPETENIDIDCFLYFKGARLLVVEDNIVNQKILQNVLRQSGIMIDIANNGEEALEYLFKEHREYDLVLMDISMPVMDGITTTKIIRRASRFTDLPIVAFTAFSLGSEIKTMFEAGANAYLTKPLDIKQLYTVFSLFIRNVNRGLSLKQMLEIQGLDTLVGLENAEGDKHLYYEFLRSFIDRYSSSVELIPEWIKEKNYERIKLECKEMLPALDLIGAYEMHQMVQEIQIQFIYHNEHLLDRYALLFKAKMQALIDTINVYLKEEEKHDTPAQT